MTEDEQLAACRKSAEEGDPEAQYGLGVRCAEGRGVQQNDVEAVTWHRKAAEQGHAAAQVYLGWMCGQGRGAAKDDAEAVKWYREAAEQGFAAGQFNLGCRYGNGRGVAKDDAEAVKWYRKAAEQGHIDAQVSLGVMYETGRGVPKDIGEGIRWYRQAAARGNEIAKQHLRRLNVKDSDACGNHGDALSQSEEKRRELLMTGDRTRQDKVTVHEPCQVLLDACTPSVYLQNAFRITGLPVDASARDVKRRIDDLKNAEELGDAETEHVHAFALDPRPTIESIREAAQRLHDPERRLVEEFFWFWPSKWGEGRRDPCLSALAKGDKELAFQTWYAALCETDGAVSAVAKHNVAVMYQLVALDSEHYALENDLTKDQLQTVVEYWRTCFKWWEELTNDETFWSIAAARIRMLDDPRLTTGFSRRMRATLPEAMDKINAMVAIAFFEKGKDDLGRNHIGYMLETNQGQDNVPGTLALVLKPLKARVVNAVENARSRTERDSSRGIQTARDLLTAVVEPVKMIQMMLPAENHELVDLCDSVAEACLGCQIAYAREGRDWATSLEILDAAKRYAASLETRSHLEESRTVVARNMFLAQYVDPVSAAIAKADGRQTIAEKVRDVDTEILSLVRAIGRQPGATAEVNTVCAGLVAAYARGLSVAAWNENKDVALAMRAIDLAIGIACDAEMRSLLEKDREQLNEIRENEELRKLLETCWFCKRSAGTESGKLDVNMYGDVIRIPTFGGRTEVKWRRTTVAVPRCDRCREAHKKVGGKWAGAAAGAAAGSAVLPGIGTIIGALVGGAIGGHVDRNLRLPDGVSPEATMREFPLIKKFLEQGWGIGNGPTS